MAISTTTVAVLAFGFLLSTYLKRRATKRLRLPPGPPADPFIGHLRIMPSDQQELVFHEWAKTYAKGLVENSRDFKYYIGRYTVSVIMRIAYGHQILSDDDEFFRLVEDVAYAQNNGGPPGGTVAEGTAERSFLRTQMESMSGKDLTDEDIEDLKGSAGVLFAAGVDTTSSSLETFVLALLHHPAVQKKGQEEYDRVIGDRLPTFEDYDALPYVGRVTMEVLRGMNLDGDVYTRPTEFNPDRFLPKSEGGNEEPPPVATFGFGRRICPGRYLAATNVWIAVATMFATVNITKATDEDGNEITPEIVFESGVTSRPKAFSCSITPRSEKTIRMVADECKSSKHSF
ncbi:hypothetical protein EYR40_001438 [Pleurotus pulmonarius]|nr:hypothetical protein EYR40_001438 [Pleurotus pulmonarius]